MRGLGQTSRRRRGAVRRAFWPAAALVCAVVASTPARASDRELDAQREAFRAVYPAVEMGDWKPAADREALLRDYILWPDLKAAWIAANLDTVDAGEVRGFLQQYHKLRPARLLRYRFALHLAKTGKSAPYLALYRHYYRDLGIARLDCLALHARILAGDTDGISARAEQLWLVGRSQVDECDPVFEYLDGAGLLDEKLLRQRFELAIDAREFGLARYLSRSMDEKFLEEANRWIAARNDAEKFLQSDRARKIAADGDGVYRKQLIFAIEQVAYSDALAASEYWDEVRTRYTFSARQAAHITRHIALSAAQEHSADAHRLLVALTADATDEKVRSWQVRTALRMHAWPDVIDAIQAMPADEQRQDDWQYWLAVALKQSGQETKAGPLFDRLAANRSYYGFLAADELDRDYAYGHASTGQDETLLKKLGADPALIRARELFFVGLESQGRSEWNDAIANFDPAQKAQAAVLAHRWNWDSTAIITVADIGQYDDLEIRYPLPYRKIFEKSAATADIPDSWAYGVTRNESLFMADVRSSAGAIGLMQLMPATGQKTAAEIDLPYDGIATLTDPASNIRLGTVYLGKMLERFGDNLVLATAAYNAGPFKVDEWLPESERRDARIWIENIPYRETRKFVRRVLFSDAIFHWRLTGETRRLSNRLASIAPAPRPEQVSDARKSTATGG